MEFYLPIASPLRADALDAVIREYDPLSAGCPPLNFRQVQGMLKGFIDLVFRHEGRYYLLDYKSNWLGENSEAYTQQGDGIRHANASLRSAVPALYSGAASLSAPSPLLTTVTKSTLVG